MRWYTIKDLLPAYDVSQASITTMCEKSELLTLKLIISGDGTRLGQWQYIIPDTELCKLARFARGDRRPVFCADHQPSELVRRATLNGYSYEKCAEQEVQEEIPTSTPTGIEVLYAIIDFMEKLGFALNKPKKDERDD